MHREKANPISYAILSGLLAGFLICCLDFAYAFKAADSAATPGDCLVIIFLVSLILYAVSSAFIGLAQGIIITVVRGLVSIVLAFRRQRERDGSRLEPLIYSALLTPAIFYFFRRLLEGRGISKVLNRFFYHWHLTYVENIHVAALLTLVSFIFLWIALAKLLSWNSQGYRKRLVVLWFSLCVAFLLYWANANLYVGLYGFIHKAIAVTMFIVFQFGVLAILPRNNRAIERCLLAFLLALIAFVLSFGGNLLHRKRSFDFLQSQAPVAAQLIGLWTHVFDFDRDGFSYVIRGDDLNDFDSTVYPNAFDIPQNGVDEDGDGSDASFVDILQRSLPLTAQDSLKLRVLREKARETAEGMNIFLIVVDGLRADHVHRLGYQRDITPNIDNLISKGYTFPRTYCQHPLSLGSMISVFTGIYPIRLHADMNWNYESHIFELKEDAYSLIALLKSAGYDTVAIGSMIGTIKWVAREVGFSRSYPYQPSSKKFWDLLRALAGNYKEDGKSFFLYLHMYKSHIPYYSEHGYPFGKQAINRFDAALASSDHDLGDILRFVEMQNIASKTIFIVMGDHGEEFGEHGGMYHGTSLYEEQNKVPLIMHFPDNLNKIWSTPGSNEDLDVLFDGATELASLYATLVDLLGLPRETEGLSPSLLPSIMLGRNLYRSLALLQLHPTPIEPKSRLELAVIEHDWKLINRYQSGGLELYNLGEDPGEKNNLAHLLPAKVMELNNLLYQMLWSCFYKGKGDEYRALLEIGRIFQSDRRPMVAKAIFNKAISICPERSDAYALLGDLCFVVGDEETGESSYRKAILLDPCNKFTQYDYLFWSQRSGIPDERPIAFLEKAMENCCQSEGRETLRRTINLFKSGYAFYLKPSDRRIEFISVDLPSRFDRGFEGFSPVATVKNASPIGWIGEPWPRGVKVVLQLVSETGELVGETIYVIPREALWPGEPCQIAGEVVIPMDPGRYWAKLSALQGEDNRFSTLFGRNTKSVSVLVD